MYRRAGDGGSQVSFMSQPIRVAITGLGQRGLQHLSALWQLQGEGLVRIAALIDAFEDNLAEAKIRRCQWISHQGNPYLDRLLGDPRGTAAGRHLFRAPSRGPQR